MNLENVLKTTGLIEKHNLTIRGPIDLINIPDTSKLDDSIWNKKQGILAIPGETHPERRHFCKLIGGIPGYNSPQPGKHVVYEIYRPADEKRIPKNRKLDPALLKANTKINGICFLMLPQKAEPYKEATLPIAGNKNRATAEDMKTFGHPEGPSMQMDPESGTVKIITKKESFTFGSSFDVGNSKVFGNFGNFVNWLTMPNPIRKCMQILIPDALPFKPLTFEPFPNVPNITLAYQQIKNFTENMILLKGVADEVKKQRQQTT